MRLLFVGDVVGRSGRAAITERLPDLIREWKLDCVIVNGENAAGGFGITEAIYQEFLDAGGILAIDDDEVESPVPDHTGQIFRDRGAACPADHVANEENAQSSAPEIEHFLFR